MDSCRRVFGTYRDYVPSFGLITGFSTEYGGQVLASNRISTTPGPQFSPLGVLSTSTRMAITTAGTNGTDYAWQGIVPYLGVTSGSVAIQNMYDMQLTSDAMGQSQGSLEGTSTGTPKPQYVPVGTPWIYGGGWVGNWTTIYKVEETYSCYGTYLPASTAQVRRCFIDEYNNKLSTSIAINANTVPTYFVENLCYVGQQIVLPDEVTSSIVRSASNGEISLHAHSVRTYRVNTTLSNSQSIILPIKVASANSLFLLFQNQNMIENPYYLSCTRNNPFVGYKWTPLAGPDGAYFVGSDASPTITGASAVQPFSIQLRLGNELLPQQPIQDIQSVIYELERSIHGSQDMLTSVPTVSSYRHYRSKTNTSIANGIEGSANTEFLCLKNNDFLTPYIPIDALDDQTITDNIAFRDYALSASSYIKANNRGTYVSNHFIPPVSKFMLGFDLETFPNQSDVARSGRYLGNGPITLQISNANACGQSSVSTKTSFDTYSVLAVVLHDIRFSIIAGGQVQAFY